RVPPGARGPRRRPVGARADRRPHGVRRRGSHRLVARVLRSGRHRARSGVSAPRDPYTHGHHESVLRSHRWRTAANSAGYLLDALTPGTRVLDVGCGPGTITIDVAQRVAPGTVVGIDREPEVLDGARDAARAAGIDSVTFDVGDVYALAFPNASFDVVHA